MMIWPADLFDFAFISNLDARLNELAGLSEAEAWDYRAALPDRTKPILYSYLRCTYGRLAEQGRIEVSPDGTSVVLNTGLVTPNQEPIYALFDRNTIPDRQPWFLRRWVRRGEHDLVRFSSLPDIAEYFDDPAVLVFNCRKELRANVEHIIADNKARFPEPFCAMDDYALQTFLKGAVDNAVERVRRNYRTAVPQYYRGRIQLLLPLCLVSAGRADLALVAEDHGSFYRASTCLTPEMAYNNARPLGRPDLDWLAP